MNNDLDRERKVFLLLFQRSRSRLFFGRNVVLLCAGATAFGDGGSRQSLQMPNVVGSCSAANESGRLLSMIASLSNGGSASCTCGCDVKYRERRESVHLKQNAQA